MYSSKQAGIFFKGKRECGLTSNFQQQHFVWGNKKALISLSRCLPPVLHVHLLLLPPPTHSYWSSHPAKVSFVIAGQSRDPLSVCMDPPVSFSHREGWDFTCHAGGKPLIAKSRLCSQAGAKPQPHAVLKMMGVPKQSFLEQRNNPGYEKCNTSYREADIWPIQP